MQPNRLTQLLLMLHVVLKPTKDVASNVYGTTSGTPRKPLPPKAMKAFGMSRNKPMWNTNAISMAMDMKEKWGKGTNLNNGLEHSCGVT